MGVDGLKKNPRFHLKSSNTSLTFFRAVLQTCSRVRPASARSSEDIGNHASPRTVFHPGGPQTSGRHFTEHDLSVARALEHEPFTQLRAAEPVQEALEEVVSERDLEVFTTIAREIEKAR